jgi:hypothetical protein
VAVIVRDPVPTASGVYVTEQRCITDPRTPDSAHELALKLPAPVDENWTAPVGVLKAAAAVSVTFAVHVEGSPTATRSGPQLTEVTVGFCLAVTFTEASLVPCVESPP